MEIEKKVINNLVLTIKKIKRIMAHENWNTERSTTQKAQVREWLLQGNHLTPLEALRRFGSLRLSAIIFDLREEGLRIETDKLQVSPRTRVADYYIKPENLK